MLRKLRSRLTYANVMSTIAVFGVLATGTAYAANTVFSTDIVDGEVKAPDIAANAVDSARVRDNTLNTFDVHSFLGADVVDGSLTGADVATTSSLGPSHIQEEALSFNNTLLASDLATGSVASAEILDGGLNDEDIGQVAVHDFVGAIGVVPASSCVYRAVTGIAGAGGDHLLLTANTSDAAGGLIYSAEYQPGGATEVRLKVCNFGNAPVDDANTHFNLLTIDAQ
jgi:hypothetical protein